MLARNLLPWACSNFMSLWIVVVVLTAVSSEIVNARRHRILLDTDFDTDDFFGLLYLLKLNRSEFELKGITINSNGWTNAGHSVNHIYDMLFMMGRDDIPVGVGGEGGISQDGTIFPNVGGYLPIIEQGLTTVGYCRYRQSVPVGSGGRLDKDTNYGIRRAFLPQGRRRYWPLHQPKAQEVMLDVISKGRTTVFLIGTHTNFALFLMKNPDLKKNVDHIYVMGGGVMEKHPTGCKPWDCVNPGNLYTDFDSNPYAEFNIFGDPFAAYQVIHSWIPVTLVSLEATNTIPITKPFVEAFEKNQDTFEAQYCYKSLKIARDTGFNSNSMWDSFMVGVAISIMSQSNDNNSNGKNEFAVMKYRNITVVTSNKPFGISDGSNPFFDNHRVPKFQLKEGGVHSGHVQSSLRDPFCYVKNSKGKCKDGYTVEIAGSEGVRTLVATKAMPSKDPSSPLDREFFVDFLKVLNNPYQSGRFNFTTQFPHYKEVLYKPKFRGRMLGRPVVFDMDMSVGDFLTLFYILKVPAEVLNLKAILITPTGWANAATIDVVYDSLHMMGRDDIPVGLGDSFATNQCDAIFPGVGNCKYSKAIPQGSGGFLDSDTLYGLARDLPRSPRRYTAENSVKFGAPRGTDHPELRQPLALQIWQNITKNIHQGNKITILTNGPLTTLSKILTSDKNATSKIQDIYVVGGHIKDDNATSYGNLFSVPLNKYAEFNMFLDPLAAKTVINSKLDVTLIPLQVQQKVSSFPMILERLFLTNKTPEAIFVHRLISTLQTLQMKHPTYQHMDMFLGELLGAVILANGPSTLKSSLQIKPIKVIAKGIEGKDGQIVIDQTGGAPIKILDKVDHMDFYDLFANRLGDEKQSAIIGSFSEQQIIWSTPNYAHKMFLRGSVREKEL